MSRLSLILSVAWFGLWLSQIAVADDVPSGAGPAAAAQVADLLQQLTSADFQTRRTVQDQLLHLRGEGIKELVRQLPQDSGESGWQAIRALERIFQADTGPDGELAEKGLEYLSFTQTGPVAAAARDALVRNFQLRESRARTAIEKLGGAILDQRPESRLQPPANAPGVGVGFGPESIPAAILLLENWRGQPEDLWHIRRFSARPHMVVYVIRGSGVNPLMVRSAAAYVPDLAVEERGAASFGIKNSASFDGCVIGTVLPRSAAEQAGLLEGDRILVADGEPINSFYQLIAFLLDRKPGEVIHVTIDRRQLSENGWETKVLEVDVRLGSWRNQQDPETAAEPPLPFQGPEGPSYNIWVDRPPPVPQPAYLQYGNDWR